MAVERFLPDEERTRRAAGWVFILVALAFLGGLGWLVGAAPRLSIASIVWFGLPSALLALGLWFAFRRRVVIAIDPDARTYAVIRNGARIGSGSLDSLGPLTVTERTRVAVPGTGRHTMVEYVVNPAVHSNIDLYVMGTPAEARQKVEKLAGAWRVSCQSWGGVIRRPEDLDAPLVRRLRGDSAAHATQTLHPEWGLRVEPLSSGYVIVPTSRSWVPLAGGLALTAAALVLIVGRGGQGGLPEFVQDLENDLLTQVLAGLGGLVLLAVLWKLGRVAREALAPASLRITEAGVSYRHSTIALGDVREVTATLPIEVFGRRRTLRLAGTFCPKEAVSVLAHEIQRMILEVAPPPTT